MKTSSFDGVKQYLPVLGMVLATVLGAFYIALGDNKIDPSEWFVIVTQMTGSVTVYVVPRLSTLLWLKPVVAAITVAVSTAGAAFISEGISAQEWVNIAIVFLGGLGVVLSNKKVPVTPPFEPTPLRRQASG
jgi:hypothetical protein